MQIELKMGKNFRALEVALRKAPEETKKALIAGLTKAIEGAAREVKQAVGSGEFLGRRTGGLTRAIIAYKDPSDRFLGYVGVGENSAVKEYAWLLGRKGKTIPAKNAQVLAIPVGEALTAKGAPRYASPRDVGDGFWFKSKAGNVLFGRKAGDGLQILFIGKKSVTIEASGVLPEVVNREKPKMIRTIRESVMATIRKLGIR